MITMDKLKKSISELKKELKEKISNSENPKADKDLRLIRKKLKRSQRKLRLLSHLASKTDKKKERPKEKESEPKPE